MDSLEIERTMAASMSRRGFIRGVSALAGLALTARYANIALAQPKFGANPFTLGIASGEPSPHGVVLWTRLAPKPLVPGGGMEPQDVAVRWRVASDENMRQVVLQGTAAATAALNHSVHVEVEGLKANRHYWYQFESGGEQSPVGRTKTAPELSARPDHLRFATCSCQNWPVGHYAAFRHMATQDIDLVLHLGDYIYENAIPEKTLRDFVPPDLVREEVKTLEQYRLRYALYKLDPHLQAAQAAFPFVVTWDDHEVANNYAGTADIKNSPVPDFLLRRASAYQAYYENQPLRIASLPVGPDMQLYRRLSYGDLAQFHVLDTRQYRSDQANGDGGKPRTAQSKDPSRTMMGDAQEKWLYEGLSQPHARWNVMAQQVIMAQFIFRGGGGEWVGMDRWDGYEGQRNRLMAFLAANRPRNPVVLSGDSHTNLVADLKADFDDPASRTVGSEFAVTAISSTGKNVVDNQWHLAMVASQPHLKWFEGIQRGYMLCTLDRKLYRTDVVQVADVKAADSPVSIGATWVVEDGRPGVLKG